MKKLSTIILSALFIFSACSKPAPVIQENISAINPSKPSEIIELKNGDSFDMTASIVKKEINGEEIRMLAYNGSIPGPTIRVTQNSEITINFTNKTDIETTIHPHGIRLDNEFDGTPDLTQETIKVGETFSYKIKFPDVGIYWYHPHFREDYAQESGLYGNFLVTPLDKKYWSPVNQEVPLFLDDILIDNGRLPFSTEIATHTLMGRFGDTMLTNGETDYKLNAKKGEVVRFYITNAANTRPFNFSIKNAQIKLVGGDNGKYEQEELAGELILGPSERAIIEVLFEKSGEHKLQHITPDKTYRLGTVSVSNETIDQSFAKEFNTFRTNEDTIAEIAPYLEFLDKEADKKIRFSISMNEPMDMGSSGQDMHMMHGGGVMENTEMSMHSTEKIEWEDTMNMMNAGSNSETLEWQIIDEESENTNMDIHWKFNQGDVVKIEVFNDPDSMHPMQHPIHFHGQRFLVLSTNGEKNENLVWKDTALIQNGDKVELLVEMSNPGKWMAHCHIAEHLESGMMLKFDVE